MQRNNVGNSRYVEDWLRSHKLKKPWAIKTDESLVPLTIRPPKPMSRAYVSRLIENLLNAGQINPIEHILLVT
jgi:hypothetical protein